MMQKSRRKIFFLDYVCCWKQICFLFSWKSFGNISPIVYCVSGSVWISTSIQEASLHDTSTSAVVVVVIKPATAGSGVCNCLNISKPAAPTGHTQRLTLCPVRAWRDQIACLGSVKWSDCWTLFATAGCFTGKPESYEPKQRHIILVLKIKCVKGNDETIADGVDKYILTPQTINSSGEVSSTILVFSFIICFISSSSLVLLNPFS